MDTMFSHVDDLFLVVEGREVLQLCNDLVQHDMEAMRMLIVARRALSQVPADGFIQS